MVTRLDSGGLSEAWNMTSSPAELQFADSTWTLDLPSCTFVLDHSSNAPPAKFIQHANLSWGLTPLQRALTPISYFLTCQSPFHPSKHTLRNLPDISAPLSPARIRVKYSFYVFLLCSVYTSPLTQMS